MPPLGTVRPVRHRDGPRDRHHAHHGRTRGQSRLRVPRDRRHAPHARRSGRGRQDGRDRDSRRGARGRTRSTSLLRDHCAEIDGPHLVAFTLTDGLQLQSLLDPGTSQFPHHAGGGRRFQRMPTTVTVDEREPRFDAVAHQRTRRRVRRCQIEKLVRRCLPNAGVVHDVADVDLALMVGHAGLLRRAEVPGRTRHRLDLHSTPHIRMGVRTAGVVRPSVQSVRLRKTWASSG